MLLKFGLIRGLDFDERGLTRGIDYIAVEYQILFSDLVLIRGMAFGEKSLTRGIASLNEQFNNISLSLPARLEGWPLVRGGLL